jgi:hypothetical protein
MPPALVWSLAAAAAVVVLLLLVVRARRRPAPPPRRPRTGGTGPQPGEIWWAEVPYEDGPGSKVRPCLVLRSRRGGADVLKITSQDQSHRADHIEIPTRSWDKRADHNSFLDLTDPHRLGATAFQRRAGTIDGRTWALVRTRHQTGATT